MSTLTRRATVYFDPAIHRALLSKTRGSSQSVSRIVHEALRYQLAEDEEDIKTIEERKNEPTISFEEVGRRLKKKWESTE